MDCNPKKTIDNNLTLQVNAGSALEPSYAFDTDPNSGLYSIAEDKIGIATNGTNRLSVENDIIDADVAVDVPLGTNAAKALTFNETYLPTAEEFTIRGAFTGFANRGYIQYVPEISKFVAFSFANAYTSSDGITWTAATFSTAGSTEGVRFGYKASSNTMILPASSEDGVLTSTDSGATWTETASLFGTGTVFAIDYSTELDIWVAVGDGAQAYSSPDGSTWTTRTIGGGSSASYNDVIWVSSLGLFIACASGIPNGIRTSPDGITWTARTAASIDPLVRLVYHEQSGEVFISSANLSTQKFQVSTDGITWTNRTQPIIGSVYSDGKLLYVCPYSVSTASTLLYVSLDNGSNFRTYETNTDDELFSVAVLPGTRIVAVGAGNTLTNVSTIELNNPGLYVDIDGLHPSSGTYFPNSGGIVTDDLTATDLTATDITTTDFTTTNSTITNSTITSLTVTNLNSITPIVAGTWTPVTSGLTNVSSIADETGSYLRIGDFVFCLMSMTVDPSVTDPSEFGFYFTLPIAIGTNGDLQGNGGRQNNPGLGNFMGVTNDTVNPTLGRVQGSVTIGSALKYTFTFNYLA